MSEIDKAKELYENVCSIGERLGPIIRLNKDDKCRMDSLSPLIQEELAKIEILEKERIIRAPSPWHAALWGILLADSSTKVNEKTIEEIDETNILASAQRWLFRGHPDSAWEWNLTPKLERPKIDKYLEACACDAFCSLLDRLVRSTDLPILSKKAYIATAQHYGIATHLLDFTTDPSVAVFFASYGKKRYQDQDGVVFLLDLNDGLEHGVEIILPPPFVERLYVQLGVFVESSKETTSTLRNICWQIHFPFNSSFKVIRNGIEIDLFPSDPWLERVNHWARNWASKGEDFPKDLGKKEKIFYEICKEFGYPEYFNRLNTPMQIAMWMDRFSEFLYWLAIFMVKGREGVDSAIAHAIAKENPIVIEMVVQLYESLASVEEKQGRDDIAQAKRQLAQNLREILAKCRSNYESKG